MCYSFCLSILTLFIITCFGDDTIQISFTIQEELPMNTPVGNIATEAKLAENLTSEEFNSISYGYIGDNLYQNMFSIDQSTGALQTNMLINRETITECSDVSDCILVLNFVANSQKTNFFKLITNSVHVQDINDHAPSFPQPIMKLNVSESSPVGTRFSVPAALDKDTGRNGIQNYDIYPDNGPFGLNYTKKLDGSFLLHIVLKQPLNREIKETFTLQIAAKDGGEQPQTGILNIDVTVLDVNDHAPKFGLSMYNVTVREDVPPNTVILKVTAEDPDKDQNGLVSYHFSQVQTDLESINQFFRIDSDSGEITLLQNLVYEPNEEYSIIVEASDHGTSPQISQVKVNVKVEDVGNNKPVVKINLPSAGTGGVVMLSEATNIDNFVAHVNVEDSDIGNNGNVTCSTPNPYFDVKKLPVSDKGFKVVVKQKLDREQLDAHIVTIVCHDYGTPRLSAEASFNVTVSDDNDNDPEFLETLYLAYVDENNKLGNPIKQVSARDKDIGINADIQYFLHSDAVSKFAINSNTGVISASDIYDREKQLSYLFHVLAVDNGDPRRTGTASVRVTIRDENDNIPVFNKSRFTFEVAEGLKPDETVGSVVAIDKDDGLNGDVSYTIAEKDQFTVPFVVLLDGTIRTREILDREKHSQYSFIVYASDKGIPSKNNSVEVIITVSDVNDNEPTILFPKKGNNTVTTAITSLPVTTIIAEDKDIGVNRQLSFYIFSGNEANMFYLNPTSGELFLNKQYHFSKDTSQSIRVCVQDAGNPVHSDCADLNVLVIISNSTHLSANGDSNKYITISIIVVIVTLLISAAIGLTIYFLWKIDKKRQEQKYTAGNGPLGVPMQTGYLENSTSNTSLPDSFESGDKKRKEVSFSPGTSFDNSFQRSISPNSNDKQEPYLYDKPSVHHSQPYSDSNTQALQLKQILLKNNTETEARLQRPHPSDNHSDSSGETTTSDSGRGGSEDEVPGSTLDDSRSFEFQCPPPSYYSTNSYSKDKLNMYRNKNSDNRHMPRPNSYNIKNNACAKIVNNLSTSQPYLDNSSKDMQYHSWDFLQQSAYAQYPRKDRDYFHLRPESLSTLRSRDDDDDAATTTSGSYTINPEELEDELFHAQRDLVV
ncbi:PCDHD1 [Mytilus coruscus]|uniref:Protocadherin-20 n=1 Tax=Mytilus coruscus TaxID=42192 RepID=A0A6J8B924_MYTCO|nr:PCDHD1 [Mytilus coruscus]